MSAACNTCGTGYPNAGYVCGSCGRTLVAVSLEPAGFREALQRLANASRNLTIVQYRYAHQTGSEPTTDEKMDGAAQEFLDATEAAFKLLTLLTPTPPTP